MRTRSASILTDADRREAEAAIADYNVAAGELKFCRANVTAQRLEDVAKRLRDIGRGDMGVGRKRFREALTAIPHWRFLAGREKPRDGRAPFRLNLERLLSTGSGMGDVLAKLIDLHDENGPAPVETAPRPASSSFADSWRESQALELAEQRARWAKPGDKEAADAVH